MSISWFLATEEAGFGLNFDILETNIINLAIVIGVLVYFGKKFLGGQLADRRAEIESAIKDAEQRKKEAASALAEQQQKLAQSKADAKQILANAEETAKRSRESILAQAEEDVERMKATAARDLSSQQDRVIRELRQRISELAIQRAESDLPNRLNDDLKRRLADSSIALLGGNKG
ncbi:ATP synthase F0 subunit B [filamentous cyanobacterium CCP5]|nr:ATP synthase F0 subunit B [filamentous cyanobacterium CCP5]